MAATLSDSFLADLDELSDVIMEQENIEKIDVESFSSLLNSQRYKDMMQIIEDALLLKENHDDYNNQLKLIQDINALLADIEDEIMLITNFIRQKYGAKFPELESSIDHPIVYVQAVKKIGNETNLNLVSLQDILPSRIFMSVLISGSSSIGKPLPDHVLHNIFEACDCAIELDLARNKMLDLLDSKMAYIAPNLSAIVGTSVAAKLVGCAGGLDALAKIAGCNLMLLGAKKSRNLAGFSFSSQSRVGFIQETELFLSTPPPLRMKMSDLVGLKSALAARVDSARGDPTGTMGRKLRDEICKKIDKCQEAPPARILKPLSLPLDSSNSRKKRGGRRLRKAKERYELTNPRKWANRMPFGAPENSSLGDGYGVGYGMNGQAGNGMLRVSYTPSKLAIKAAKKYKQKHFFGRRGREVSSSSPCLEFTPVQGIELPNQDHQFHSGVRQSTYFSETGTFSKIRGL